MSGHSKWHNIQAKKGKADAARGAVFTKIGREIAIAVRDGGANPESNGKLRDIIAKAKANNMPNDNIQRSIKKASGELSNVTYEQITYEAMRPAALRSSLIPSPTTATVPLPTCATALPRTAATSARLAPSASCSTRRAFWWWNAPPVRTKKK